MKDTVSRSDTTELTETRRRFLKYTGATSAVGLTGLAGVSLFSRPALAISGSVNLPSGLEEGTIRIKSYELTYSNLDTSSDITLTYSLTVDGSPEPDQQHTVSISESNGTVMTGNHTIEVPAGDVSLVVTLSHPSIGDVSTEEPSSTTTVAEAIPSSGVLRWSCVNENSDTSVVKDVWNSNDGTVTNASYNASGGNDGNGAYEGDCNIEVSTSVSGGFSFSGWFYAPWSSGDGNKVVWNYTDNGREIGIHYNNDNNSGGYEFIVSATSVASNVSTTQQWIHIVGTYNGAGTAEIYVNGSLENSGSGLSDPASSGTLSISQAVKEGKDNNLRLADFRQYSKVLTSTEVSNLYNNGQI